MNDAPLPSLPPDLAELLAAERARPDMPEAAAERILARLATTVSAAPRPRRVWPPVLGSFVLGLLVGGAVVGGSVRTWLGPVPPKLLVLDAPLPPPPAVVVVAAPRPAPGVAPLPPRSPVVRHGGARVDHRTDSPGPAAPEEERDTELARERALIETARTALSRNQTDAIDVLLRHAQQFPSGRLAEERESLLVQALLQAGRPEEARRRGARFRARWPHSLLLPVIDAALRTIP